VSSAHHTDGSAASRVVLSHADRCAAAGRLVRSQPHLSDRAIAASTGLSAKTVANIRARRGSGGRQQPARLGLDGRSRPVDPAARRRLASLYLARNPGATLREVARVAGISPGTARDVRDRVWRGEDPVPARLRSDRAADKAADKAADRSADTVTDTVVPRPREPEPAAVDALRVLRRDPTIRYVGGGRRLLHLLNGPDGNWQRVVDTMPPHCMILLAAAARDCARAWEGVADHVEKRLSEQR
jgi:hypothetical protein